MYSYQIKLHYFSFGGHAGKIRETIVGTRNILGVDRRKVVASEVLHSFLRTSNIYCNYVQECSASGHSCFEHAQKIKAAFGDLLQ